MPWDWLTIGLITGIALFLVNLAIHVTYAFLAVNRFERRPLFKITIPEGPQPEPFAILSTDGMTLRGGIYLPEQLHPIGVILFCPEADAPYRSAYGYVPALLEAGFAVVSFDFRNIGESDAMDTYQPTHWLTAYETSDLREVIQFVTELPQFHGLPVGLMGVSRGAAAALVVGARSPEIRSLWVQGAFSTHEMAVHHGRIALASLMGRLRHLVPDWHIRITVGIMMAISEHRLGCRYVAIEPSLPAWRTKQVLFVTGNKDSYVPLPLTDRLVKATGHYPDADLWIVPGARHNQERMVEPEAYDRRLVQFFQGMVSVSTADASPVPSRSTDCPVASS